MILPNLFCPDCRAFKRWWEATYDGEHSPRKCKKCGTECVFTEDFFADFIVEKVIDKDKYKRPEENKQCLLAKK